MNMFKKEPAVIIGALVTILSYVQNEIATQPGHALTYRSLLPLFAAALIRFAVYSPDTVEQMRDRTGNIG